MAFKGPRPEIGYHVFRGEGGVRQDDIIHYALCYDDSSGALAAKAEQAKLDEIQNAKREAKKIKSKEKGKVCKVSSWAYWHATEMILTLR